MKLLGIGGYCRNQIVKIGSSAYGIQGHFELTPHMFEEWMTQDPDLSKMDQRFLRETYKIIKNEYEATGKQIFTNFLRIAKSMELKRKILLS